MAVRGGRRHERLQLARSVTLPVGCTATLAFYVHIDTAETTTTTAYDKLTLSRSVTPL